MTKKRWCCGRVSVSCVSVSCVSVSCVCRPSPKLVLVILQLCRVALPIMSADDCELIELPAWGESMQQSLGAAAATADTRRHGKALMIAHLLLAKLGDFLVPGNASPRNRSRPAS